MASISGEIRYSDSEVVKQREVSAKRCLTVRAGSRQAEKYEKKMKKTDTKITELWPAACCPRDTRTQNGRSDFLARLLLLLERYTYLTRTFLFISDHDFGNMADCSCRDG